MSKKNLIIRSVQEKNHLYGYQVARILNVSESTYCRKMREELPVLQQERIARLIEEAVKNEEEK